jgi:hypothetical protein
MNNNNNKKNPSENYSSKSSEKNVEIIEDRKFTDIENRVVSTTQDMLLDDSNHPNHKKNDIISDMNNKGSTNGNVPINKIGMNIIKLNQKTKAHTPTSEKKILIFKNDQQYNNSSAKYLI